MRADATKPWTLARLEQNRTDDHVIVFSLTQEKPRPINALKSAPMTFPLLYCPQCSGLIRD